MNIKELKEKYNIALYPYEYSIYLPVQIGAGMRVYRICPGPVYRYMLDSPEWELRIGPGTIYCVAGSECIDLYGYFDYRYLCDQEGVFEQILNDKEPDYFLNIRLAGISKVVCSWDDVGCGGSEFSMYSLSTGAQIAIGPRRSFDLKDGSLIKVTSTYPPMRY